MQSVPATAIERAQLISTQWHSWASALQARLDDGVSPDRISAAIDDTLHSQFARLEDRRGEVRAELTRKAERFEHEAAMEANESFKARQELEGVLADPKYDDETRRMVCTAWEAAVKVHDAASKAYKILAGSYGQLVRLAERTYMLNT
jgi:hypothetical protein